MITFKKVQNKGKKGASAGKWYARPVISSMVDIEALAEHMSKHNTPFSPGVIKGVLTDMVACIKELVLDGKSVKLDDLAIFSCGLQCTGANTAEAFSVQQNVKKVRLRARATGNLRNSVVSLEATLRELGEYSTVTE